MDYLHLLSPALVVSIIIACLCIAVQIIADVRRTVASRRLYAQLFARLREQQAKPVTVVIELRRAADTVLPLLNHLQQQNYTQLTVVVIVKQTAGRHAQAKLATYRQASHYRQLRLVKHRKGMTVLSVVRRYAPRGLVMQLNVDDRVGCDFFYQASFHFVDRHVAALIPRGQVALNTSLSSGLQAVISTWSDFKKSLVAQPPLDRTIRVGVVYRAKSLLSGELSAMSAVYSQTAYMRWQPRAHTLVMFVRTAAQLHGTILWIVAACIALCIYGAVVTGGTLGYFLLAMYCLLLSIRLSATKGYSLLDKLTIILFSPFSFLWLLGVGVAALVVKQWRVFYRILPVAERVSRAKS